LQWQQWQTGDGKTDPSILQGIAREVPVFGYVGRGAGEDGLWVTGVIDELCVEEGPEPGQSATVVRELKTRRRASMPTAAQQRCTALQLMLYKKLWDNLVLPGAGVDAAGLAREHRLDLSRPLSSGSATLAPPAATHLAPATGVVDVALTLAMLSLLPCAAECIASLSALGSSASTLAELIPEVTDALAFCPMLDPAMHVRYEHVPPVGPDGAAVRPYFLGEQRVLHDEAALADSLARKIPFWRGHAPARPVSRADAWKCRFCVHASRCDFGKAA